MPYLVPVEIRESTIQGKGVFALQDIPKGTVCWVVQSDNPIKAIGFEGCIIKQNVFYTQQQLKQLSKKERAKILHFSSYDALNNRFYDIWDGNGFTNHSSNPSTKVIYSQSKIYNETKIVAIKDISKGQQLTQNYNDYPFVWPQWLYAMIDQDLPERAKFEKQLLKQIKKQ